MCPLKVEAGVAVSLEPCHVLSIIHHQPLKRVVLYFNLVFQSLVKAQSMAMNARHSVTRHVSLKLDITSFRKFYFLTIRAFHIPLALAFMRTHSMTAPGAPL